MGASGVTGIGPVAGVECVVAASDPTVRGGATNPFGLRKTLRAMEIAERNRLPLVQLIESSGAVKTLRAKSIVRIDRGRGTYPNPPDRWTDLEALVRAVSAQAPTLAGVVPERLIEARRVIETGAAELAATRRTPDDLARLQVHLDEMVAAADNGDVDAFVTADLAFHQTVLDAADNAFIAALLEPLSRLLIPARRQTSEVADIRRHAIEHHRAVLDAIRSGDPERARRTMHDHIDQTGRDLRTYVLKPGPRATKAPSGRG